MKKEKKWKNREFITLLILLCHIMNEVRAECYIMGDSIAQGVAINRRDCSSETQVGLNTKKAVEYWLRKGKIERDKVIISLGVNDGNINTMNNLMRIRNNIKANQVIWILPPKEDKSREVRKIASEYGDFVLNIKSQIGKDNIHPTGKGYITIANHIKLFQYQERDAIITMNSVNQENKPSNKYQYDYNYVQN